MLFYVIAASILGIIVTKKPALFWPVLLLAVIMSSGIMVEGYGLIDELFFYCILAGGLVAFSLKPLHYEKKSFSRCHNLVFMLFVFYMIFQSIRGMIVLEDLRMFRFIILFIALAILSYIVSRGLFPVPSSEQTMKVILKGTLIYLLVYLGVGFFSEQIKGIGRYDLEGVIWSGTTAAMFPLYIAIQPMYHYLKEKSLNRIWGWLFIIVAIVASFYYDSRIAWFALIGTLLLSFRDLGLTKIILIAIIFLGTFYFTTVWGTADDLFERFNLFIENLFVSAGGFAGVPRETDIDRKVHVITSFYAATDDWLRFIFGSGFYTHRYVMLPYFLKIAPLYGIIPKDIEIIRPATFSAFLVDTGFVGISLLFLNFFLTAYSIVVLTKNGDRKSRKMLIFSLILVFLSTLTSTNYDIILFYLAIMPSGLLIQMSRDRANPTCLAQKNDN